MGVHPHGARSTAQVGRGSTLDGWATRARGKVPTASAELGGGKKEREDGRWCDGKSKVSIGRGDGWDRDVWTWAGLDWTGLDWVGLGWVEIMGHVYACLVGTSRHR